MATTYNDLYLDARRALKGAGVDQAQLEARELLCLAADKSREQFVRDLPLYAPDHVERRFRELMERRLAGEPLAYILGEWDFYGLTLDVGPDVLIPRPDTETLVDRGILAVRDAPGQVWVLDLCAGSGCVGLAMANSCPNVKVILADWSEEALTVCRQNIRRCRLTGQATPARVNAMEAPPKLFQDFDVILCNPPYISTADWEGLDPSVRDYEPRMALDGGPDGLAFYRAIADRWKCALRPGGKLIFEIGYDQAPAVEEIMVQNGYENVQSFQDPAGHWRVVEGSTPRPDLFAGLIPDGPEDGTEKSEEN